MSNSIKVEILDQGICTISLNRTPVNALSFDMLFELNKTFQKIENNATVRIVILKSNLKHFSAGADLKERKIMSKKDAGSALDNFNDCFNTIENLSKPVICLINGYCLGGGAELSLSCDIRVGSKDSIIGFPEVSIGIIPGAGGTQRLPKTIGISNAKYWIYSAKKFTAEDAYQYGFLNFMEDYDNLLDKGIYIAKEILKNAPIAVSCSKRSINMGYNKKMNEALEIERNNYKVTLNTKDRDEALDAFINKRKPIWKNE